MSEYQEKPNTAKLFRNTKKVEGKNHPDMTGYFLDANGKKHKLSMWSQTPKSGGDTYLSGQIGEWVEKPQEEAQNTPQEEPVAQEEGGDNLPF